MSSRKRNWLYGLLSVFILWQLTVMVTFPNPSSAWARMMPDALRVYANLLGQNTTWQFFSPEPSAYVYFEYDLLGEDKVTLTQESLPWPPPAKGYWPDTYQRLIYNSRYVTMSAERMENYFVPYLCRRHPEAEGIHVRTLSEELPPPDRARLIRGGHKALVDIKQWNSLEFACPRG